MDRDLLAAVLDGVPLPMLLIGVDQRIRLANGPATALFGAAVVDHHFAFAVRHPNLVTAVELALRGQRPDPVRLTQAEEGTEHIYRVTVSPVLQASGMGALCAFEDLSEQELVGQMRRDFVANVSHELRTPLTAMIGIVETLKGPAHEDAGARDRFLSIMEREAGRMNRLVRDLLSLSRVEAEERQRPTEAVDLAGLLGMVVATLRPVAVDAAVNVVIKGDPGPRAVLGDADQLTQVFTNLIENAIKYGSPGKQVTVDITASDRDSELRSPGVRIAVIDQGEGIDAIHLPRLTERFYRVDAHRSREKGGTGLGLAIVKHIVSRHRGKLRIASEKGQGSTFAIHLPVR